MMPFLRFGGNTLSASGPSLGDVRKLEAKGFSVIQASGSILKNNALFVPPIDIFASCQAEH
jgi:hypothetical protein